MDANQLFTDSAITPIVRIQCPIEYLAGEKVRINWFDAAWLGHTLIQIEIVATASRRLAQQTDIRMNALHVLLMNYHRENMENINIK